MARKGRQTARKLATKLAHLRKKMEKARFVMKTGKTKRRWHDTEREMIP
jgi:hypothetical protein